MSDPAPDADNPVAVLPTNSLPDLPPAESHPNEIPKENMINPTELILMQLQEMATSPLSLAELDPAEKNSTLGVPNELLVTKASKKPSWGPKTKRAKDVISAKGDESNSADAASESAKSNQSDLDDDETKNLAKNHFPTLAERKAFCPKLLPSHIDEDGPLSKMVRRKSGNSEVIPEVTFKCSKDAETRQSPSVEKYLSIGDSEPISEDEARKRKYQPQVVVKKIDESSVVQLSRVDGAISVKSRGRHSSADSRGSSGSKKLKKEK